MINDPPAETDGVPDFFRGDGDPSLEYDAGTGTLWMSYSWLNLFDIDPGPGVDNYGGVRTHLARSDDGGNTFQFVRSIGPGRRHE